MKPIVYIDIDNVILQLDEGVKTVLAEQGITYRPELQTSYYYDGDIGCDKQLIYDCFSKIETYQKAPLVKNVKESINTLRKYATVYGWSQIIGIPEIKDERIRLCEELNIIPKLFEYPHEEKIIDNNVAAVFEDCPTNLEKWQNTDTDLYLISQPYNEHYHNPRVIRVYDINEGINKFINRLKR